MNTFNTDKCSVRGGSSLPVPEELRFILTAPLSINPSFIYPRFVARMADIDPLLNGSPLYLLTAFSLWLARAFYRRLNFLVAHCSFAQVYIHHYVKILP